MSRECGCHKKNADEGRTERVDPPNNALNENLVLVQRDERTEHRRGQQREHDRVARPVALKHLALDERVARKRAEFETHLALRLAPRQRLGLREEVGEEDAVVRAERVVRVGRREEVGRDELGALVQELVEGVLAVGACSTPDDGLWASDERVSQLMMEARTGG